MFKLAGQLLSKLGGNPQVQRALAGGGKELLAHSVPGAVMTGMFTTLSTGNPVAGLAVGATDLLGSAALAKGVGKLSPKLAGRYQTVIPKNGKSYQEYSPSVAQNIAMGVGSVGAALAVEPLFAGNQLANINPQQLQQLIAEPVVMDQTATSEQQLIQRQLINNLRTQALSPGTMFQMQGVESTLMRPTMGLDQFNISSGSL
jgi:hypothetical protein